MKRSALTIAISSLLLAGAAQAATVYDAEGTKLDVYGRIIANYYASDDESAQGDASYARFGFKGETNVGGGWTGFGKLETQLDSGVADITVRHMYTGLKSDQYGTVTFGRQYGLFYSQLSSWTDMLMEFGNDALGDGADKFGTGRNGSLITYVYETNGLTLAAQATLANTGSGSYSAIDADKGSEEGYALSAAYAFGNGFTMGAVYNEAGKTDAQSTGADFGGDDRAKLFGIGAKYEKDALYMALNYSMGENHLFINDGAQAGFAEEHKGLEAVAQYYVNPKTLLGMAYLKTDAQQDSINFDDATLEYMSIHGAYYFQPNFFAYVDYKLNMLDNEAAAVTDFTTEDVISVALRYDF